jgi:hypothetical protein
VRVGEAELAGGADAAGTVAAGCAGAGAASGAVVAEAAVASAAGRAGSCGVEAIFAISADLSAADGCTGAAARPSATAVSLSSVAWILAGSDSARCLSNSAFSSRLRAFSA